MMKPDAVLINTSRGGLIDEDALVRVMTAGHLAGAGLDVTETEPLPADHPLRGLDRVILTPHILGHTIDLYTVMPDVLVENATRIKRAETPKSKNMERKNRKVVSRVCCKIYVGLRAPHVTSCKSSDIVEACIFVR